MFCRICKGPITVKEAVAYNNRHEDCWVPRTSGPGTVKVMKITIPKKKVPA